MNVRAFGAEFRATAFFSDGRERIFTDHKLPMSVAGHSTFFGIYCRSKLLTAKDTMYKSTYFIEKF